MEISLTKRTELKFRLNISGAKEVPEARLFLNFGDYSVIAEGFVSNNIVKVSVPDLSALKNEGFTSVAAKLEVIVNGQYIVPWFDSLDIEQEIVAEAALMSEDGLKESEETKVEIEVEAEPIVVHENYKAKNVVFPHTKDDTK